MRRSIEIEGFKHSNPIPAASRIGPLIETGIIVPFNPGSSEVPDGLEDQIDNLFKHIGAILEAADADWRHVAKINFFVTDLDARATINGPWLEHFPDAETRPARHTQTIDGSGPVKVSCVFTAYVED